MALRKKSLREQLREQLFGPCKNPGKNRGFQYPQGESNRAPASFLLLKMRFSNLLLAALLAAISSSFQRDNLQFQNVQDTAKGIAVDWRWRFAIQEIVDRPRRNFCEQREAMGRRPSRFFHPLFNDLPDVHDQ